MADEPRETIRRICRERGCRLIELGVDFDFDYEPPRHLELAPSAGRLRHLRTVARQHIRDFPSSSTIATFPLATVLRPSPPCPAATRPPTPRSRWRPLPTCSRPAGTSPTTRSAADWRILPWPARVEVVARRPTVVLDAAHNVASIEALVERSTRVSPPARRLLVFATTQDKDHRGMLAPAAGQVRRSVLHALLEQSPGGAARATRRPGRRVDRPALPGLPRAGRRLGRGPPDGRAGRPDLRHRFVLHRRRDAAATGATKARWGGADTQMSREL